MRRAPLLLSACLRRALVACGLLALTLLPTGCGQTATDPGGGDAAAGDASAVGDAAAGDAQGGDVGSAGDSVGGGDAGGALKPPELCFAGEGWDGKSAVFTDVTDAWGFGKAGAYVRGIRVGAADLDGDGYAEVFVRKGTTANRSTFGDEPKRYMYLMRNKGAEGPGFTDITQSSGVLATRDGVGGRPMQVVVAGDVDNDGDLDLFAGVYAQHNKLGEATDVSELLLNDGKGNFSFAHKDKSPWAGETYRLGLTGATFVDYNRDGTLDLWLGYGTYGAQAMPTPDLLFSGDGKGGFTDVTDAEGLMTQPYGPLKAVQSGDAHRNTWSTGACDLNDDGHPDLLTTSYGRYFNGLWLGGGIQGSNRFFDAMHETGYDRDDNDDWTSNWNAQCYCKENPKAAECDTCGPPQINCTSLKAAFGGKYRWNHTYDRQPWRLGGTTGTNVCADIDRDGDFDLLQMNIVHSDVGPSSDPSHLIRNDGGVVPKLVHLDNKETGLHRTWPTLSWNEGDITGAVADFDNDGRLDLILPSSDYPDTRLFLYHQQADGSFVEVAEVAGISHNRAIGVAVADFDRDGDLDLVIGSSRSRCKGATDCPPDDQVRIYRNETRKAGSKAGGNFVALRLVGGKGSNRSAIGARVRVTAGGVTQTFQVDGGHGHFALQHDLVVHVGLGKACQIDKIEVRWPDAGGADGKGSVQTWTGVRANYLVELTQGEAAEAYPMVK